MNTTLNLIKNKLINNKWFYITVILILLIILFSGISKSARTLTTTVTKTDTIYINKPYKQIVIQEVVKPQKVYIYKRDTILREKIIRDTILIGLSLNRNKAKIHTITPMGITTTNEYPLPDFKNLSIDYEGNLNITPVKHPKRKKTLHTIGAISIFIGGVFLGTKFNK